MTSSEALPTESHNATTRFRFKRKHSSSHVPSHSSKRRRHHHHHRHQSIKETSRTSATTPFEPSSSFDAETAFRESLFDAMADDEGAAFWEGVYGQPIRVYAQDAREGVDAMNEEEYVAWVRGKMWERSREGIEAARQAKAEERKRQREKEEQESKTEAKRRIREEEVRRERRRRPSGAWDKWERNRWDETWEEYLGGWEELKNSPEGRDEGKTTSAETNEEDMDGPIPMDHKASKRKHNRPRIIWPVRSGRRNDVATETVENFMRNAPVSRTSHNCTADLLVILKAERIRWHPDKIQQRFGSFGLDEETMKAVTAVFQILDRMWGEAREIDDNRRI